MASTVERLAGSRFLRFALVGTGGFFVNEAALWIALHVLHLNAYFGGVFSFLCAVTFTWWGNRTLTFREHAAHAPHSILAEWTKFVAANGLGFLVNYGVYVTLIALAPRPLSNPFLALALGTLAGLTLNFFLSSRIVFNKAER